MGCRIIATVLPIAPSKLKPSRPLVSSYSSLASGVSLCFPSNCSSGVSFKSSSLYPERTKAETVPQSISRATNQICRAAAEYKFPDPIPEFAEAVSLSYLFLSNISFLSFFVCFLKSFLNHLIGDR